MLDEQTERRIARYVAGECSAEEANQLRMWITADPARAAYLASLERIWGATGTLPAQWDPAAARASVRARVETRASGGMAAPAIVRSRPTGRRWQPWYVTHRPPLAALAAALVIAAGAVLWRVATQKTPSAVGAAAPRRTVTTQRGQLADVYLSDGTHVQLGVASRLRFAAPFGSASRDVYLDGEAIFEVAPNAHVPFVVHTSYGTARDIGTRFDVKAYPTDSTTTVVVAEGRVLLAPHAAPPGGGAPSASALLGAGDLGQSGAGARVRTRHNVAVDRYMAWTNRRLALDDVPLRDALPQLSRWYDLEFRLGDSALASRRLTATLTYESVPELLRDLSLTLEVRTVQEGRVVTLFPKARHR